MDMNRECEIKNNNRLISCMIFKMYVNLEFYILEENWRGGEEKREEEEEEERGGGRREREEKGWLGLGWD